MNIVKKLYYSFKSEDIKNVSIAVLVYNAIVLLISVALCLNFRTSFSTIQTILIIIPLINSIILYYGAKQFIYYPDEIYEYRLSKFKSLAILISSMVLISLLFYILLDVHSLKPNTIEAIYYSFLYFVLILEQTVINKKQLISKFDLLNYYKKYLSIFNIMYLGITILSCLYVFIGSIMPDSINYIIGFIIFTFLIITSKSVKSELLNLLDKMLPEELQYDIIALISENYGTFCEFKSIRASNLKDIIIIDLDLVLPEDYAIVQVFELETKLKADLEKIYKKITIKIHPLPCLKDCKFFVLDACPIKQKTLKNESE